MWHSAMSQWRKQGRVLVCTIFISRNCFQFMLFCSWIVVRRACYNWGYVGCIIFGCLFCGWVFSNFFGVIKTVWQLQLLVWLGVLWLFSVTNISIKMIMFQTNPAHRKSCSILQICRVSPQAIHPFSVASSLITRTARINRTAHSRRRSWKFFLSKLDIYISIYSFSFQRICNWTKKWWYRWVPVNPKWLNLNSLSSKKSWGVCSCLSCVNLLAWFQYQFKITRCYFLGSTGRNLYLGQPLESSFPVVQLPTPVSLSAVSAPASAESVIPGSSFLTTWKSPLAFKNFNIRTSPRWTEAIQLSCNKLPTARLLFTICSTSLKVTKEQNTSGKNTKKNQQSVLRSSAAEVFWSILPFKIIVQREN